MEENATEANEEEGGMMGGQTSNSVPHLNLQPRVTRAMMLEFDAQ